jgi:hypothetical protein
MSATPITIPPLLTALIGHLAAAVPARARTTFAELLVGAATTRGGHVTDAILGAVTRRTPLRGGHPQAVKLTVPLTTRLT